MTATTCSSALRVATALLLGSLAAAGPGAAVAPVGQAAVAPGSTVPAAAPGLATAARTAAPAPVTAARTTAPALVSAPGATVARRAASGDTAATSPLRRQAGPSAAPAASRPLPAVPVRALPQRPAGPRATPASTGNRTGSASAARAASSSRSRTFTSSRTSRSTPVLKKVSAMPVARSVAIDRSVLPPAGFPGPDTTGVPSGVTLRPSGSIVVRDAGAVIDGLDIAGCVFVEADDVTIRRSRIRCTTGKTVVVAGKGVTGLVISDSELDAGGKANATFASGGITLLRNDMHHLVDGPRLSSNSLLEGNWIHDLVRVGDSHNDALQSLGAHDVVIRHNSLQAYSFGDPHNSAIMLGTESGTPLADWLVEGNYLDGGNVMINMRLDAQVAGGLVFRDNAFGGHSRYQQTRLGLDRAGVSWAASNCWARTGLTAER